MDSGRAALLHLPNGAAGASSVTASRSVAPPFPPSPTPGRISQAMVVAAAAVVPLDAPAGSPLLALLQALLPQHCPSATAAKRAIRRRLVVRIPAAALGPTTSTATPNAPTAPASDASAAANAVPAGGPPSSAAGTVAATAAASCAVGERPHPAGVVAFSTGDTAGPGDVLQLLARGGTGIMDWVAPDGGPDPWVAQDAAGAAAAVSTTGPVGEAGSAEVRRQRASCSREGGADTGHRGVSGSPGASQLPGLPVAYEDEHVAVVIKPPGIDTQGSGVGSVQGRLKYCLRPTPLIGALNRPQQVHRLDAPTGGLLLAAKTHAALKGLGADLAARRVGKRYCALVKGLRSGSGTIDMPLSGKPCLTSFAAVPLPVAALAVGSTAVAAAVAGQVHHALQQLPLADEQRLVEPASGSGVPEGGLAPAADAGGQEAGASVPHVLSPAHGPLTKVHLWPHTGRTHQLRKHMAYTGTPMLGDARYRAGRPAGPADPRVTSHPGSDDEDGATGGCTMPGGACSSGNAHASQAMEDHAGRDRGAGRLGEEEAVADGMAESSRTGDQLANGRVHEPTALEAAEGWDASDAEWEVHRPPVDAEWALAAAAAAASGGGCAGDVLSDGSPVSLCLWAVGLRFRHPLDGRGIEVDISGWADAVYDSILRREAAAAAAKDSEVTAATLCPN